MTAVFAPRTVEDVLREVARRGLEHVTLGCFDWDGRLRAKHYAAASLADAFGTGLAMTTAIFALGPQDIPNLLGPFADPATGYPDGLLALDPLSARSAPFEAGGAGLLVLGDFRPPHADYCPRSLLGRELGHWAARGLTVRGGFELEFMLLDESARSLAGKSANALCFAPGFERMYSLVDQAHSAPFLQELTGLAAAMRCGLVAAHHEFQGLIEAVLAVAEGVAIADACALVRSLAAIAAAREERLACFMARVSPARESCGAHLNLSFDAREGSAGQILDARGEQGLSTVARGFLAGLERFLPELFALCAPNVNSYKRFAAHGLAPRANAWGIDNKTCAYRVVTRTPAAARIEVRVPGADVQPHLALAAALAAGRAGLEQGLVPSPPCTGDANAMAAAAPPFPRDLRSAVAAWRVSPLAAEVFGPAFVDAYARSREWQLQLFDSTVTDWELQMYARQA